MLRTYTTLVFLLLFVPAGINAQNSTCFQLHKINGEEAFFKDDESFVTSSILVTPMENAGIVFCPAGIERSSPNDIKKKFPFEWTVKYNNIYLKNNDGIVFEGMNEHGFSASLMYLNNSILPKKEKENIPIAASLSVNFFIDHFKCVDTALLAVWDIRIFDDIGLDCGWPFRIILHDSTGATAYIEFVDGQRQVYSPEAPTCIVGGPAYARLLTIKYLEDSIPQNDVEKYFLSIDSVLTNSEYLKKDLEEIPKPDMEKENFIFILKRHMDGLMIIVNGKMDEIDIQFSEIEFNSGKEVSKKLFE